MLFLVDIQLSSVLTMSGSPPNKSSDPLDHLAMRYLRQVLDVPHPVDEPYVLNKLESRAIQQAKTQTLVMAALLGVIGVLLLYLPQYIAPAFFSNLAVSILGWSSAVPVVSILYGLLLVYLEIYVLTYINLRAVRIIMEVCQFPRAHDAQYERHLKAIAEAALQKPTQSILSFGIDPYLGLPRWGLSLFFLVNTITATLGDVALRFLLKRVLGRLALRQVTDLVGIPIFAFWNAFASWHIIHEAQVRVMAPLTIREFVDELYEEWGQDADFRGLILEALQFVAILKRQYNYAHHLLTETIVDRFNLEQIPLQGNLVEQFGNISPTLRKGLERLIIFGVVVDGRLSWVEKRRLHELRRMGWLSYSMSQIEQIVKDYINGRGLWV